MLKQASVTSSGKVDYSKLESVGIGDVNLSAKAFSNIFTDILSKMNDVNTKELLNREVSVAIFDGNDAELKLKEKHNTNVTTYDETASHQGVNGKSLVTEVKQTIGIYTQQFQMCKVFWAHMSF